MRYDTLISRLQSCRCTKYGSPETFVLCILSTQRQSCLSHTDIAVQCPNVHLVRECRDQRNRPLALQNVPFVTSYKLMPIGFEKSEITYDAMDLLDDRSTTNEDARETCNFLPNSKIQRKMERAKQIKTLFPLNISAEIRLPFWLA
ncbi:hypothetical protein PoB_000998000 [Plakobranchus ocellatus]|uniref:Uncharacterized protein n=1 Tax=Plakobranchus ocellatus TaxID=259542 RepID=A0AAV3YL53_9GAST|nr:hypothetical protein PoB_000998000 [Plakobranchus ocellatus]